MTFPSTLTIFNWHRNLALDATTENTKHPSFLQLTLRREDLPQASETKRASHV
jgi:hypothetical protein